MTTPRDLLIVALDAGPGHPVESGDLSLALAGAEVIDLLDAGAVTLDDDRIVPGNHWTLTDRQLDEAASALVRERPYESVEDWLWRRGRGLSAAYLSALSAEGVTEGAAGGAAGGVRTAATERADGHGAARQRRRWNPFRAKDGQGVPADSPARRHAADRWASGEPVLAVLAAAAGIHGKATDEAPDVADDAVVTVLAAVNDAVMELEAVRQRRAIEEAAFDNIWRGQ
ncbi:GPP34 family phosphoprotein [Streptomyces sp. Ru73]|uniref:GPP34 family phosphoprotein n=1 Tax=Streptomyces sp. Ru73 TaxID=2080748 RepID=UPI000CDD7742|nr:GPP34 family phosphoprotein [Streptomyces sp. Ru73]POX37425.1 GPP34 family phosphoprotein [Streptomyces sp. Ru73]